MADLTKVKTYEITSQNVLDQCVWDTRNITDVTLPVNKPKVDGWIEDRAARVNNTLEDIGIQVEEIPNHPNVLQEVKSLIILGARSDASRRMQEVEGQAEILEGRWEERLAELKRLITKKYSKLRPTDSQQRADVTTNQSYDY